MDQGALTSLFTSLGAFAPCAALGFYVIRYQQTTIQKKDDRIDELTKCVIAMATKSDQTNAELAAALRAAHP